MCHVIYPYKHICYARVPLEVCVCVCSICVCTVSVCVYGIGVCAVSVCELGICVCEVSLFVASGCVWEVVGVGREVSWWGGAGGWKERGARLGDECGGVWDAECRQVLSVGDVC